MALDFNAHLCFLLMMDGQVEKDNNVLHYLLGPYFLQLGLFALPLLSFKGPSEKGVPWFRAPICVFELLGVKDRVRDKEKGSETPFLGFWVKRKNERKETHFFPFVSMQSNKRHCLKSSFYFL